MMMMMMHRHAAVGEREKECEIHRKYRAYRWSCPRYSTVAAIIRMYNQKKCGNKIDARRTTRHVFFSTEQRTTSATGYAT